MNALFPIRKADRWGFIACDGRVIVEPQFDSVLKWSEGFAAFQRAGKYGFVDSDGKVVCEPVFDKVRGFTQGQCGVTLGDQTGFIGTDFRMRFLHSYKSVGRFREGLALAERFEANDYLDQHGNVTLRNNLLNSDCHEGLIAFHEEGASKVGFKARDGSWRIKPVYARAGDFSEGLASVTTTTPKGKRVQGFINQAGEMVFTYRFVTTNARFSEGLAAVSRRVGKREMTGYINKTGEVQIDFAYDWADPFSEGLARVIVNRLSGFIDSSGRSVISVQFDSAEPFEHGLAWVCIRGKMGYVDRSGTFVYLEA